MRRDEDTRALRRLLRKDVGSAVNKVRQYRLDNLINRLYEK